MNSSSDRLGKVLDLLAVLVALSVTTLAYEDRPSLRRDLLALGFAFFVPGCAIVSNWPTLARRRQWPRGAAAWKRDSPVGEGSR